MKTYQALARTIGALNRCLEWQEQGRGDYSEAIKNHEVTIAELLENFPHGSGFDNGTTLDTDDSTGEKLVFTTAYHHMNDGVYYDGWTQHIVTITPSLEMGYHIKVAGVNRNDIKSYIAEQFSYVLDSDVQETVKA